MGDTDSKPDAKSPTLQEKSCLPIKKVIRTVIEPAMADGSLNEVGDMPMYFST
jgi:hypothetical protein